ncbi:DUF7096 domain-containing protein [Halomarina ordinaria]|uniref:DUF4349 domain-containing protein n=1 Tax=Halomarina ordinaria TaxID=3033939 RepID=A0ABD5U9G4_9EURY|nr:hypothetical protein [Halomarina sp. PSRA2]
MERALAVVLALCCVLSMSAAAVPLTESTPRAVERDTPPAAMPVVTVNDTTNYLDLNRSEDVETEFGTPGIDVSASLATDTAATRGELDRRALDRAYSEAETTEERRAVLLGYTQRAENLTADLRSSERRALARFVAGQLSAERYLQTLAELHVEAERTSALLDRLATLQRRTDDAVPASRLNAVQADLVALEGPVRDRLASVYSGSESPERVAVEATGTGVVLSVIVERDGRPVYVREAYLGEIREASSGEDQYGGIDDIQRRAEELYPWASSDDFPTGSIRIDGLEEVYRFSTPHPQGELTTFIDGQSDSVFREYQEKDLALVPVTEVERGSEAGLELAVSRTYPGGPVLVETRAGDESVNATVTVDDEEVGTTGADGERWVLMPSGDPVTVSATTPDAGPASVTVPRPEPDANVTVGSEGS